MSSLEVKPSSASTRQLDREPVAVPAALALDVVPAHRLVAREDVLEHARQHVVEAGRPVGGRRSLVEAPLRRALAPADRLGEHVALAPALEHALLELGERGARVDRAVRRAGHGRRILGAAAPCDRESAGQRQAHGRDRATDCAATRRRRRRRGRTLPAELGEQRVARGDGRLAEPADRAGAGVGDRAAVVEDRDLARRPSGPRRRAGRSRRARRRWPRQHDRRGVERAQRAAEPVAVDRRASATASASRRAAAPARAPARDSASRSQRGRGVEDQHALGTRRRRSEPALERRQPAGRVAPGELVLDRRVQLARRAWAATASSRTSSIVRSTERSARLSSSSRLAASSSNARERARQPRAATTAPRRARARARSPRRRCGSRRASAAATRSRSSAYWRWPPGERCGLREVVAALPAAQRVGADAEHHRGRVCPDSIHCSELCPYRQRCASTAPPCCRLVDTGA